MDDPDDIDLAMDEASAAVNTSSMEANLREEEEEEEEEGGR